MDFWANDPVVSGGAPVSSAAPSVPAPATNADQFWSNDPVVSGSEAPLRSASPQEGMPSMGDVAKQFGYGLLSGVPNAVASTMNAQQRGREMGMPPGADLIAGMIAPMLPGYQPVPGPKAGDTLKQAMGSVGLNPDTLPAPQTAPERVARMGGEGAVLAVAPELAIGRAAEIGSLGNLTRAFVTGTAAGTVGQAATELAPENLKPVAGLVGGLAGGAGSELAASGLAKAGEGIGALAAPFTQAGREATVGQKLVNAAESPEATIAALGTPSEIVPGSAPTTFQQTGDMGLGSLERSVATQNPAPFLERRAQQNAARTSALSSLQAEGNPAALGNFFRSQLADLDQSTQGALDTAIQNARTAAEGIGGTQSQAELGTQLRDALQARLDAAKAQERSLWSAVDPTGTFNVVTAPLKQAVASIYGQATPEQALTMTPRENQLASIIADYQATLPFARLTELRSAISAAMREAKGPLQPNDVAYGRLSQLRGAVEDAISNSIENKAAEEQQAVASGALAPEDTMAAKLAAEQEAWRAQRKAATGTGGQGSAPQNAPRGTIAVSGVSGAEVPPTGRYGNAPGAAGFPQNAGSGPLVDQGAADRLAAATAATKARKQAFGARPVANILQREGATYPYKLQPENVLAQAWKAGPAGEASIAAVLRAANNSADAVEALKAGAAASLRKAALREDGTVDPAKFASWRNSHAGALNALNAVSPGTIAPYENAARAAEHLSNIAALRKEALADFEKSAAGKLLGVSDPADVVKTVGSLLGQKNSVALVRNIATEARQNPAAFEGLRRAFVEFAEHKLISNTEAGTSGQNLIKADQFQTFLGKNEPALRQVFTEDELKGWRAIARDLNRANRSISAVRLPGQSNTAQDLAAMQKHGGSLLSVAFRALGHLSHLVIPGAGYLVGETPGLMAGLAADYGATFLGGLRQAGISKMDDLLTEAMLNPQLAKTLMQKAPKRPGTGSMVTLRNVLRGIAVAAPTANVVAAQ
ncbi:MAG: hypothetical protein ACTHOR_17815 [Devosia sp.]